MTNAPNIEGNGRPGRQYARQDTAGEPSESWRGDNTSPLFLGPAVRDEAEAQLFDLGPYREFDDPDDLADHIAGLSDDQLVAALNRHYGGGWDAFREANAALNEPGPAAVRHLDLGSL